MARLTAAPIGILTLATLFAVGLAPVPPQPPASRDPLTLFKQLLPVITHPRCLNCHGGVDPFTGQGHQGGVIPRADGCNGGGCHEAAPDRVNSTTGFEQEGHWHTPGQHLFFVNKDAKALCAQFADFVMHAAQGVAGALDHLENDKLIEFGFVGLMAGARDPPPPPDADPPPMTKRAFVDSARVWMTEGQAACDVEGTIVQDEEIHGSEVHHLSHTLQHHASGEYTDTRITRSGKRNVKITLRNGQYQVDELKVEGGITTEVMTHVIIDNRRCSSTVTNLGTYSATTSGAADVDIKVKADPQPYNRNLRHYVIKVSLPPENTVNIASTSTTTNCPVPTPASIPPESNTLVWPAFSFTIEGSIGDPRSRRLVGACDKLMVGYDRPPHNAFACLNSDEAYQSPFLLNVAGASQMDGSMVPIRVHTSWNLLYTTP